MVSGLRLGKSPRPSLVHVPIIWVYERRHMEKVRRLEKYISRDIFRVTIALFLDTGPIAPPLMGLVLAESIHGAK